MLPIMLLFIFVLYAAYDGGGYAGYGIFIDGC